jgi:lipid A ethanolaminephosphotransferase
MSRSKSKKLDLSYTSFSLLFTTTLYVIWNSINIDKIDKWFHLGKDIDYTSLLAFLTFGLCFFIAFFVLLAHRWTVKPVAIFFIIVSAAASYFIAKYNVAIDGSMVLNTLHTDPVEATGLLSVQMIPYLIFLILLPILVISRLRITFHRPLRHIATSISIFVLAITIAVSMVYLKYDSIHRAANLSNKYIVHSLVPVNYIISIASVIQNEVKPYFKKNKVPVVISGQVTSQDDLVVVLVIGESSRKKSFSLYGYDKHNTNPVLSKYTDLHLLTGIASIGSTLFALPQILEKKEVKLPAITSKLGIDTSCYVNYTLYDNCAAVGETKVSNCGHGGDCYDEDVIPLLASNLQSYKSGYRFIVLHAGGGSHGPKYRDRYPPEFQYFNPQCLEADVVNYCSRDELYNSYDNTILYVDHVLGKVIETLDESSVPYVFIYLSDHGESLLEDGHIFHGMPPGISLPREQAEVPLIVKSSIPISVVQREEYPQQDVYDTVLSLFSIETDILDKDRVFIKKKVK